MTAIWVGGSFDIGPATSSTAGPTRSTSSSGGKNCGVKAIGLVMWRCSAATFLVGILVG